MANHQEFQDCSKRSRLQICAENLLKDSPGNISFWLFWNNYFLQNLVSTKFGSRKFISINSTDYILSTLLDTSIHKGVYVYVWMSVCACMYVPKNLQVNILKKNFKVSFWILLSTKKGPSTTCNSCTKPWRIKRCFHNFYPLYLYTC